jgi:hypothetical protein
MQQKLEAESGRREKLEKEFQALCLERQAEKEEV